MRWSSLVFLEQPWTSLDNTAAMQDRKASLNQQEVRPSPGPSRRIESPREHNVHAKNGDRVLGTWFVSHSGLPHVGCSNEHRPNPTSGALMKCRLRPRQSLAERRTN